MKQKIRIGNAGGYWGDDLSAFRRQLEGGPLDYITMDFLAEITMSILQKQRQRNPQLGYAGDFVTQVSESLKLIADSGTTVITNAGGINPIGLGRKLAEIVKSAGQDLKIGVVSGDDILPDIDSLMASGESFANMETGEPLGEKKSRLTSANVYFGAEGVVRALAAGCRIVVTGRVTDTGITLAPMMHEFGWKPDDWDRIASGIVAGHIIECGAQASGGNITDWQRVKSFHNIGYPIIEMHDDGTFIVTKHPGTGGMVSEATVKEQLVYEMGDPAMYISPDGIARFDSIQLRQEKKDRVRVFGIKGLPAPTHLKVSMSHDDGWKASGELLLSGPNADKKAKAFAELFWRRLGHSYEETRTELIGSGSIWPAPLGQTAPHETLLRFGVRDQSEQKVDAFGKLLPSLILSGPSGVAVTAGGRPKPSPVVAYWPTLIAREKCTAVVTVIGAHGESTERIPLGRHDAAPPTRPLSGKTAGKRTAFQGRLVRTTLRSIAYARSGDKGDTCNIGLLARSGEAYDWLRIHLKATVVKRFFKGITKGEVIRYELDNLQGLNFLLEETLGGGGTRSLMLDPQGKTLSQALLQLEISVPASVVKSVK